MFFYAGPTSPRSEFISDSKESDHQTVIVNDCDALLSVTRIHPVVMLQTDRKSLLLWASVTHNHMVTTVVFYFLSCIHSSLFNNVNKQTHKIFTACNT